MLKRINGLVQVKNLKSDQYVLIDSDLGLIIDSQKEPYKDVLIKEKRNKNAKRS